MKEVILIISLFALVSCGSESTGGGSGEKTSDPVKSSYELNPEERALKNALAKKQVFTQQELMQELIKFRLLERSTLKKLDHYINIQCIESGLCYVSLKD